MSDPMSNLEIEDVLSSIRRLVAQEGGVPAPEGPSVAGAEAVAAGKFVLTPDFRVREGEDDVPAEPAPMTITQDAAPQPLGFANVPLTSLEDTIAELEAAVAARGGEEWEPDGGAATGEPIPVFSHARQGADTSVDAEDGAPDYPADEPLVLAEAEDFLAEGAEGLAPEPSATRIVEFPVPRPDAEEEATAEAAGFVEVSDFDYDAEYAVDYEEVEEAPFIAVDTDEGEAASATLHDLSARRLHLVTPAEPPHAAGAEEPSLTASDTGDAGPEVEIVGIGEIDPPVEEPVEVENPVILTEEDAFRLDVMSDTIVMAETLEIPVEAVPRGEDHAFRIDDEEEDADLFAEEEPLVLNEEELRDMVAEIIRQELQGALGERITRNVRKMVRAEIRRALASKDFE